MDRFEFHLNEETRKQDIKYFDSYKGKSILAIYRKVKKMMKEGQWVNFEQVQKDLIETEKNKRVMSVQNPNAIKISEVKELLKKGYSRYEKDDTGVGSVQKHYSLTWGQTKALFNHEKLKGLRRHKPKTVQVVDDQADQPAEQKDPLEGIF